MLLFLQSASVALRTSSIVGSGCNCPWARAKQVFSNPLCLKLSLWVNENKGPAAKDVAPDAFVR
jgi:hypothetical protein